MKARIRECRIPSAGGRRGADGSANRYVRAPFTIRKANRKRTGERPASARERTVAT